MTKHEYPAAGPGVLCTARLEPQHDHLTSQGAARLVLELVARVRADPLTWDPDRTRAVVPGIGEIEVSREPGSPAGADVDALNLLAHVALRVAHPTLRPGPHPRVTDA